MTTFVRDRSDAGPRTGARLLHGVHADVDPDPSLLTHEERWGPLPSRAAALLDELEASGLTGRGGASFPVATKWRGVAAGSRRPVVVANGAESEPASRKDALLLTRAPHLVLDGLALAAEALRAQRAVVYVPAAVLPVVDRAVAERRGHQRGTVEMEVMRAPDTYLAGQESAVAAALNGRRPALPSFTGLRSIREHGVGGRPTLVQNAETLAHVALIARFGASWFRGMGAPNAPGTMLMTVTRDGNPLVVEAALGTSLVDATGVGQAELTQAQGILLGGYGGAWVSPDTFAALALTEKAVRQAGATLGPGIVAVLGHDVCPLAEMADVARFMQSQGAGQCGPCVHGLAEIADAMDDLAFRGRGSPRNEHILQTCALVAGRGACRHPDGVARFVTSGLAVFAHEVAAHQQRGACGRIRAPRVLPLAHPVRRRLVSRS